MQANWNDDRIDDLAGDVRSLRNEMREGFESVNKTITDMRSDEVRELRERLDRPRRILLAITGPVAASVLTLLLNNAHVF